MVQSTWFISNPILLEKQKPRIALSTLQNDKSQGGLKAPNVLHYFLANQIANCKSNWQSKLGFSIFYTELFWGIIYPLGEDYIHITNGHNLLGSGGSAAMCHGFIMSVCYHALMVFVVFRLDGHVFMLSGVMHIPNVVSSLFGCFRV